MKPHCPKPSDLLDKNIIVDETPENIFLFVERIINCKSVYSMYYNRQFQIHFKAINVLAIPDLIHSHEACGYVVEYLIDLVLNLSLCLSVLYLLERTSDESVDVSLDDVHEDGVVSVADVL